MTLEWVHCAVGFVTSLALRRKFLMAKKAGDQTMQAWIGQTQSLAFRMTEAGIAVSDQDRILVLTMGLPVSYDPVIINFDLTPHDQLTLNHVIIHLLNEELCQASLPSLTNQEQADGPGDAALAVSCSKSGTSQQNRSATDVTCFFCDGKGHYKSECPEKSQWEKMKKAKGTAALAEVVSDDEGGGYFFAEEVVFRQ